MGWERKPGKYNPDYKIKRCPMCEQIKEVDQFYAQYDEQGLKRISTYCRKCELKYQRMNYIPVGTR